MNRDLPFDAGSSSTCVMDQDESGWFLVMAKVHVSALSTLPMQPPSQISDQILGFSQSVHSSSPWRQEESGTDVQHLLGQVTWPLLKPFANSFTACLASVGFQHSHHRIEVCNL